MKYAILCSFILGSASVAFGQTRMPPPTYNNGNSGYNNGSSGNGWDNPQTRSPMTGSDPANRVGTFQIMLQAPPIIADNINLYSTPHGFGLVSQGATFGYVGLSGGIGYTLSSLVEIGGAIQFSLRGVPAGSEWDLFGEPFVKLNLGPTFKTGAINPFVLAGLALGAVGSPGAETFFGGTGSTVNGDLQIDIDPGVEWLVGGRWGFDFFIPIDIDLPLGGGSAGIGLGVGYGLVAYL